MGVVLLVVAWLTLPVTLTVGLIFDDVNQTRKR